MKKIMEKAAVLFLFLGCLFAFGCASTMPISDGIIREIGGIDNADQFQYYVSKTITLTLVDTQSSVGIEGGQLIRASSTARDTVTIEANLPGIVRGQGRNVDSSLNPTLLVAFEQYEGDFPTLAFGKYRVGTQERYYLLYQDADNDIVVYGDNRYSVSFDDFLPGFLTDFLSDGEQPYLLIKGSQSARSTSTSRRASGLRLE